MPPRKTPLANLPPAKPDASLHMNLLWIQAPAGVLDDLLKDAVIELCLVARPAPDMAAFLKKDHTKLIQRLQKLDQVPQLIGSWV